MTTDLTLSAALKLWREHGGSTFGPRVEHVSMKESDFLGFCRALRQSSPPDGQTAPDAWWTDIFESLPNGKLSRLLLTADQVKDPDPDWKPLVFATPSSETKAPGEEH